MAAPSTDTVFVISARTLPRSNGDEDVELFVIPKEELVDLANDLTTDHNACSIEEVLQSQIAENCTTCTEQEYDWDCDCDCVSGLTQDERWDVAVDFLGQVGTNVVAFENTEAGQGGFLMEASLYGAAVFCDALTMVQMFPYEDPA